MLILTKLYLYRMLRTKVAWVCMIILVGLTAFTLSVNYMIDKMTDSMAMDGDTSVVMEEEQPETETSILSGCGAERLSHDDLRHLYCHILQF